MRIGYPHDPSPCERAVWHALHDWPPGERRSLRELSRVTLFGKSTVAVALDAMLAAGHVGRLMEPRGAWPPCWAYWLTDEGRAAGAAIPQYRHSGQKGVVSNCG